MVLGKYRPIGLGFKLAKSQKLWEGARRAPTTLRISKGATFHGLRLRTSLGIRINIYRRERGISRGKGYTIPAHASCRRERSFSAREPPSDTWLLLLTQSVQIRVSRASFYARPSNRITPTTTF